LPKGEDGGKKYNSSGAVGRAALAAALRKDEQRKKSKQTTNLRWVIQMHVGCVISD
jgi:hypothetical protein